MDGAPTSGLVNGAGRGRGRPDTRGGQSPDSSASLTCPLDVGTVSGAFPLVT